MFGRHNHLLAPASHDVLVGISSLTIFYHFNLILFEYCFGNISLGNFIKTLHWNISLEYLIGIFHWNVIGICHFIWICHWNMSLNMLLEYVIGIFHHFIGIFHSNIALGSHHVTVEKFHWMPLNCSILGIIRQNTVCFVSRHIVTVGTYHWTPLFML